MANRFRVRSPMPFVALSNHKRRDAVVRLKRQIACQTQVGASRLFYTHHLLIDPECPQRQHTWIDVCFLGTDRYTLWNAEIITLEHAFEDVVGSLAFDQAYAQLNDAEKSAEFSFSTVPVPRKHPKAPRMREWIPPPKARYPQFENRTFREECERIKASLRTASPPPVVECFDCDRSYAYGIGLHAVVAEANLDAEAVERTVQRFRDLGERNWRAT